MRESAILTCTGPPQKGKCGTRQLQLLVRVHLGVPWPGSMTYAHWDLTHPCQ